MTVDYDNLQSKQKVIAEEEKVAAKLRQHIGYTSRAVVIRPPSTAKRRSQLLLKTAFPALS